MTSRENVLRALRRDHLESVPFSFDLCPPHREKFKKVYGTEKYWEYFNFPIRGVEPNKTQRRIDYSKYYGKLPENANPIAWLPDWGIMGVSGSMAHFKRCYIQWLIWKLLRKSMNIPSQI